MSIKDALKSSANTIARIAEKHGPTAMVIVGTGAIIAGTVMACRATLKANDILDAHSEDMKKIEHAKSLSKPEEYSDNDIKKDKALVYISTTKKFAKLYGPSLLVEAAGIACLLSAFGVMKNRYGAAMAAFTALDQKFSAYRKRVIETYGADAEKALRLPSANDISVQEKVVDENGEEKTVDKPTVCTESSAPYTYTFDKYVIYTDRDGTRQVRANAHWDKNYIYNENFLTMRQNYWNDYLTRHGYVFLNDILKDLDFEPCEEGHWAGWYYDPDDNTRDSFIDFDITRVVFDSENHCYRLPREDEDLDYDYDSPYMLTFNVDGNIYNKVFKK